MIELDTILTHASYTIGAGAFWGQFFLVFLLGSGIVTFPISCLITWADRPQPTDGGGFKKKKDLLIKKLDYQLKLGREVYNDKILAEANYYTETKYVDRFKQSIGFAETSNNQHKFETNCILIENEFRKLL